METNADKRPDITSEPEDTQYFGDTELATLSSEHLGKYLNQDRKVTLPGLGISVDLPDGTYLYLKGATKDPMKFNAELALRARGIIRDERGLISWVMDQVALASGKSKLEANSPESDGNLASCFEQPFTAPEKGTLFAISKKDKLEHSMDIFVDGYESGKFLWKTGRQDLMSTELSQVGIDVKTLQDADAFADACGFLALKKAHDAGDSGALIPDFKSNRRAQRIEMGKRFGLKEAEDQKKQ